MLIQDTSNQVQVPQPVRLASDGAPTVVTSTLPSTGVAPPSAGGASPSNVDANASLGLPKDPTKQATGQPPTAEQLKTALDTINKTLKQNNKSLEFSVDKDTHKQVVKLVDTETGDVVRQFPSEQMLAISQSIDQYQHGLLLKQEA